MRDEMDYSEIARQQSEKTAKLYYAFRKKGRAFKPSDFDPYRRDPGEVIEIGKDNIDLLKQAFAKKG